MTKINYKSLLMGIIHSVIIPFMLVYISKNIFIGLAYYIFPLAAYETFASEKIEGKTVFYVISIPVTSITFFVIRGM
ncbi:hypothetical protein L5F43_03775 [Aliarcobacter butzleri]|uniref:Uncharacterized protein n=2 Tax=Aliarcobacter butzleri TaxID=28197 RepID=A0AAW7PUK1_9BACT|nr:MULTISPECIES: hypothetical protein [Arcobacteraceae]KLE01841.1 hypothetical protein AA20_02135 [Aliarcobacter butzleri L348]MCG3655381.1 hypothetical protein [Aliarcobacter butzleri]MCG3684408.1 hypothetical protein [Aliarcobacter butzleri]MCG3685910.1 hypothetical protein [Aliarcobacter butzleri]MCG3705600.1 hypothetical protein [Aliarcobacter butzleri]